MTKSRMTATLIMLSLAAAAPAQQPADADAALRNYRALFKPPPELDCPRGGGEDADIVVCGRRRDAPQPERLPLPVEPVPGERIAGEIPSGLTEMKAGSGSCSTVGPHQRCSGGLPVFAIAVAVAHAVAKAVAQED
ncbi:MAG TPA: hypothetical protein VGW34_14810 [Allosphingosinicella sp.]|nr:hypothetical protein [Allosphingosinicella sp.]